MTAGSCDQFVFGIYPYIALAVFLLGSLARFDGDQYTWKATRRSAAQAASCAGASNLFHFGILVVFFGHLFGFLTPHAISEHFISAGQAVDWRWSGAARRRASARRVEHAAAPPAGRAAHPLHQLTVAGHRDPVILWVQLALGLWTV